MASDIIDSIQLYPHPNITTDKQYGIESLSKQLRRRSLLRFNSKERESDVEVRRFNDMTVFVVVVFGYRQLGRLLREASGPLLLCRM